MHRFTTNVIIKRLISGTFTLSFYYSIRELLGCIVSLPMSLERGISQARSLSLSLFITAYVNYWDASFCYQCHYKEAYLRRVLSLFYYSLRVLLGCIVLLPLSLERGISQARSLSLFITAYVNYWDASFCY